MTQPVGYPKSQVRIDPKDLEAGKAAVDKILLVACNKFDLYDNSFTSQVPHTIRSIVEGKGFGFGLGARTVENFIYVDFKRHKSESPKFNEVHAFILHELRQTFPGELQEVFESDSVYCKTAREEVRRNEYRRVFCPVFGRSLSNLMASPDSSGSFDGHLPLLEKYRALGGNCLHLHGEGGETHGREAVGKWLREKNARERFFICTQICHDEWNVVEQKPVDRFHPAAVSEDITRDLDLLGTNHLDMVYLSDNPGKELRPTIEALLAEQKAGRIGTFGFYNWSPERIVEANEHAAKNGAAGTTAIITTELALANPTEPLWPGYIAFGPVMKRLVQQYGMTVLAWIGDINQGQFLFESSNAPQNWRLEWVRRWKTPENEEIAVRAREVAANHNISTRTLNAAWVLNQDFPVIGIINLASLFEQCDDGGIRASRKWLMPQAMASLETSQNE